MLSVCSCTPRPPGRKSTRRPSNPFLIGPASTRSHQEACRPPPSRFRPRIRVPAWAEFGESNPRTTNFAIGSPSTRLSKAFEFRRNRHNELCSKYEAMGHEGFRRMTGAGAHPEFARRAAPPSLLPLVTPDKLCWCLSFERRAWPEAMQSAHVSHITAGSGSCFRK